MRIVSVVRHRESYRDLLLLADEQWDMVEQYLYRGDMFVLVESGECLTDVVHLMSVPDSEGAEAGEGFVNSAGERGANTAKDERAADSATTQSASCATNPDVVCACMIVTDEGRDACGRRVAEIKNLAVAPAHQRRGYGRELIEFAAEKCAVTHDVLQVGTGDSPLTVPFYEACGFVRSHTIPNFFLDHYDHPIFEGGVQLRDMVYLTREL